MLVSVILFSFCFVRVPCTEVLYSKKHRQNNFFSQIMIVPLEHIQISQVNNLATMRNQKMKTIEKFPHLLLSPKHRTSTVSSLYRCSNVLNTRHISLTLKLVLFLEKFISFDITCLKFRHSAMFNFTEHLKSIFKLNRYDDRVSVFGFLCVTKIFK